MILSNKELEKLFEKPFQFGLRGDPYLWEHFKKHFEGLNFEPSEFERIFTEEFFNVVGNYPINGNDYFVKEYDFYGMSSGMVNSDFWLEKGFPILLKRIKELVSNNS